MPFKGDLRLGGRHNNGSTLNGTSSDFVSVLAAGTLLSGPIDTSRYESDYVGNSFYMPYSESVYADGLGGEYSVETWGLQYLPAGWVTNQADTPITVDGNFVTSSGQSVGTTYNVGSSTVTYVEDGTGINTPYYVNAYSENYTELASQLDAYDNDGNPVYRWQIVYVHPQAVLSVDNTSYAPYGQYLGSGGNDLTASYGNCGGYFTYGSYNYTTYTNGTGGSYDSVSSNEFLGWGAYLGECNGEYYFYAGGGNTYTGCAPADLQVSTSGSSTFTWYAPDSSSSGTFTYSSWGCSGYADGNCGMYNQQCGGWSANYGDYVANGVRTYTTGTGNYDEEGNEIMETITEYWTHYFDGMYGYYTTYTT